MTFEDLEKIRQQYAKKHKKISAITYSISIPILIIILLIILIKHSFSLDIRTVAILFFIAIFAIAIPCIIVSLYTHKELQAFKEAYKQYFIAGGLKKFFANIQHEHSAMMPQEFIRQAMTVGDRYSSNDYMTATYKNINFAQADVHTERQETRTDSDGNSETYYVTIFRGRFLIFDFNRNFNFALHVSSKNFPGDALPDKANSKAKFQKLKTESNDFNKNFNIYGQDGVDTFYILDPAFIEKIQNLYSEVDCELCLTFLDGKVYIALNNHQDSFEIPNPRKPLDKNSEVQKITHDIEVITKFVDDLDLDHYNYKRK